MAYKFLWWEGSRSGIYVASRERDEARHHTLSCSFLSVYIAQLVATRRLYIEPLHLLQY